MKGCLVFLILAVLAVVAIGINSGPSVPSPTTAISTPRRPSPPPIVSTGGATENQPSTPPASSATSATAISPKAPAAAAAIDPMAELINKLRDAEKNLSEAKAKLGLSKDAALKKLWASSEYELAAAEADAVAAEVKTAREEFSNVSPGLAQKLTTAKDRTAKMEVAAILADRDCKRWQIEADAAKAESVHAVAEIAAVETQKQEQENTRLAAEAAETEKNRPTELTADRLVRAFLRNEIAAESAYNRQRLGVSGTISAISKDILGNPYVSLSSSDGLEVQCTFDKKYTDALIRLSAGQQTQIYGTCHGRILIFISMSDCTFQP